MSQRQQQVHLMYNLLWLEVAKVASPLVFLVLVLTSAEVQVGPVTAPMKHPLFPLTCLFPNLLNSYLQLHFHYYRQSRLVQQAGEN